MLYTDLELELEPIPGAIRAHRATIEAANLREICERVAKQGGRLVALWGSDERARGRGYAVHFALSQPDGLLVLVLPVPENHPAYPHVSDIFLSANRMERSLYDLLGIRAQEAEDHRKWLRHGAWPADRFPLRKDFDAQTVFPNGEDGYSFVPVEGEGAHEIPVGPVHAGTIEPGHFRFSVVGERVLRLEERLGYKHKGIEKRFEGMTLADGVKLAGRISGDSTAAYAWAYSMAVESLTGVTPPERSLWLRALLLERERIANHLGDLGFLGNDAALAFGLSQFSILKEDMLRLNREIFGHRYLMDVIVPGGVSRDLDDKWIGTIQSEIVRLQKEVPRLKAIYDEHAGLQDRFLTTGRVRSDVAARLGASGVALRAAGVAWDLRAEVPCFPYGRLDVRISVARGGDVAGRVAVRFDEVIESLKLCALILRKLRQGAVSVPLPEAKERAFGVGWIEGWRGEVLVALDAGKDNGIHRAHAHDPSWENWPLLEHAIIGDIVPDFPLINKSFNLSYSGQDL
jgi:Ni,Fe-hydrogenase III large subunit/Ni,Fe-hydrogenase III component G